MVSALKSSIKKRYGCGDFNDRMTVRIRCCLTYRHVWDEANVEERAMQTVGEFLWAFQKRRELQVKMEHFWN